MCKYDNQCDNVGPVVCLYFTAELFADMKSRTFCFYLKFVGRRCCHSVDDQSVFEGVIRSCDVPGSLVPWEKIGKREQKHGYIYIHTYLLCSSRLEMNYSLLFRRLNSLTFIRRGFPSPCRGPVEPMIERRGSRTMIPERTQRGDGAGGHGTINGGSPTAADWW